MNNVQSGTLGGASLNVWISPIRSVLIRPIRVEAFDGILRFNSAVSPHVTKLDNQEPRRLVALASRDPGQPFVPYPGPRYPFIPHHQAV